MRIFAFAGWSGSGKTTLIEQIIPRLAARGLTVSLVKHAHHRFDVDHPGKDSWRHRQAGCTEVLLTSHVRWALMHELRGAPEPSLADSLGRLSPCDIVLIEGFKRAPVPKLEILRPSLGKPPLFPHDPWVLAVATDDPVAVAELGVGDLPILRLEQVDAIATLVIEHAAVHLSRIDDGEAADVP